MLVSPEMGIYTEQATYSGTDGVISVSCLLAGMVGARIRPGVILQVAGIAAVSDAISMAASELNSRGRWALAGATFAAFLAFALLVVVPVYLGGRPTLTSVFSAALVSLTVLGAARARVLGGGARQVARTVGIGAAGVALAYGVGSLSREP